MNVLTLFSLMGYYSKKEPSAFLANLTNSFLDRIFLICYKLSLTIAANLFLSFGLGYARNKCDFYI